MTMTPDVLAWFAHRRICEDEFAGWATQFRWGWDTPGTFFLSMALQRWITENISRMQRYFHRLLIKLPHADFTLMLRSEDIFREWMGLKETFQQGFTEFLTQLGFEPLEQ
jgi:hypothetical protein